MSDLSSTADKAFDYRGDVTVLLRDGRRIVGYVFNREAGGARRCPEPYLELMPQNSQERFLVRYAEIAAIDFTGEDTAAGKSWEERMARQKAREKAPAGP